MPQRRRRRERPAVRASRKAMSLTDQVQALRNAMSVEDREIELAAIRAVLETMGQSKDVARDGPTRTDGCSHSVSFDDAGAGMDSTEVRRRWPRLEGPCPLGCGFVGIAYASGLHYVSGDW
ncbi:MAG: hypothetical protein BWY99_02154 [Synergistetes bacterium ADurb.BinA166]|mgnify:FL=1|nr:MAG: hypothetical protein BWY99_02154 [Synergistetes bacterium ADurb.BinA166]